MAEWSVMDREWPFNQFDPYQYACNQFYEENPQAPPCQPPPPNQCLPTLPPPPPPAQGYPPPTPGLSALLHQEPSTSRGLPYPVPKPPPAMPPRGDNPREIRNKAEKQRRDKLNQSIGELASMVPPVVAASRKIDKTGVLRLTAHYLRAHQYVFGDSVVQAEPQFSASSARALLSLLNGFLLTTTYRGLIVVVSQNVQQYLGYTELELLGQNVFNIIHEDDRQLMRDQLMPKKHLLGPNGELLVPDEPEGKKQVAEELAKEKRRFMVRFKKLSQRSEPDQYVTCHIEGSLRKSDRACRGYNRCCQMVRRARARGDNPCSSGNDIVFVGVVRLATETFIKESSMESYRMEYRTRHSIDGQIIQTEQRISLVTGYMTHEVNGINAMNFMHRDDVRWVVIALREMYDQHRLVGESCYRLMTKNGQFIYLRTRGGLEVDPTTRAATSFVCTNTVVDEHEGRHLIKLMKKKFMLMVNNNKDPPPEEENKEVGEQNLAVEDPRQLEKVILHLVTNLPSPQSEEEFRGESPDRSVPSGRLAIIPPKKERIVSAIEKIYSVIKTFPKEIGSSLKIQTAESSSISEISQPTAGMNFRKPAASRSIVPIVNNEPSHQSFHAQPRLPTFDDIYNFRLGPEAHRNAVDQFNNYVPVSSVADSTPSFRSEHRSSTYARLTAITMGALSDAENLGLDKGPTLKYRLYMPGGQCKHTCQRPLAPLPTAAGIKRPREYTDMDTVSKKKTVSSPPEKQEEQQVNSPSLDALFDEALTTYPQIETEMTSLENTIDPDFPNLLVSQDVEEILNEIEDDHYKSNPNT